MIKLHVIYLLEKNREAFSQFQVETLFLFGSVARDEELEDSDVDILVKFSNTPSFDQYMDLKFFLEDLLKRKVDLITDSGLRDEIRPYIQEDLIRVA